jgi:hypothetical protein
MERQTRLIMNIALPIRMCFFLRLLLLPVQVKRNSPKDKVAHNAFLLIGMVNNLSKSSTKNFDICSGEATKGKPLNSNV